MKSKLTVWKMFIFIMTFGVFGTIWKFSMDSSKKPSRIYITATPKPVAFDSKLSREYTLKKIANITLRNINNDWLHADDVCYTGVVFPSFYLTSTLANATVYVHNENELYMTLKELKTGSWPRQNLDLLLEGINRLENATFIDIYAGSGIYSLPVARLGRKVIAVEYRYKYAERLCRGIIAGQFQGRVTIVNNMLSNGTQVVKLPHYHRGEKSQRNLNVTSDVFTQVSSIPFYSLLDRFAVKEAVLKIDMDRDVIQSVLSSGKFFEEVKVHSILLEWRGLTQTEYKDTLISFFATYNLIPCINPTCLYQLQESTGIWPSYIWLVNKVHISWSSRPL